MDDIELLTNQEDEQQKIRPKRLQLPHPPTRINNIELIKIDESKHTA